MHVAGAIKSCHSCAAKQLLRAHLCDHPFYLGGKNRQQNGSVKCHSITKEWKNWAISTLTRTVCTSICTWQKNSLNLLPIATLTNKILRNTKYQFFPPCLGQRWEQKQAAVLFQTVCVQNPLKINVFFATVMNQYVLNWMKFETFHFYFKRF